MAPARVDAQPRVPRDHAAHADDVPRVRPARVRRSDSGSAGDAPDRGDRDHARDRRRLDGAPARAGHDVMTGAPTRVLAPNPSVFTGRRQHTYLLGGPSVVRIDPGPDADHHLAAILDAAGARGCRIGTILLTHSHPDHRPLALRLARQTGATVHSFEPSAGDENGQG